MNHSPKASSLSGLSASWIVGFLSCIPSLLVFGLGCTLLWGSVLGLVKLLLGCQIGFVQGVLCGVGVISNAGKREEGAVRAVAVVVVAATVLPLK